jgi:hypothetical protein
MSKRMLVVIGVLVVVAVLFFVQNSKNGNAQPGANGSGACQVQVTADVLNVRSGPAGTAKVVAKLTTGAVKPATKTVQNGYRELAKNQWASDQFLKPVSGSC